MSDVRCFWLEPTDEVRIFLRRYYAHEGDQNCDVSGYGYHNASVRIEDRPVIWADSEFAARIRRFIAAQDPPRRDPRWPAACTCGYMFRDADEWQVSQELIYRRADNGEPVSIHDDVPGMMWDAWWMGDHWRGADGVSLVVKLPGNHDWPIDGPSFADGKIKNDRGWSRSGTPPLVTARPSIRVPGRKQGEPDRYHGWLTNGVLAPC